MDSQTVRLEKKKNELQSGLEKELDRRSSDWSFKIQKIQLEEKRLRERVRELAEQNVSLQREVSFLNGREGENMNMISHSEQHLKDLKSSLDEMTEEKLDLDETLANMQEQLRNAIVYWKLFSRGPDTPIDWPTRMNIIIGVTRGLCYIHTNENLVHGNLTGGNILLDEQTNPRISDYGISQLMNTTGGSNVAATAASLGYRAPELSKLKKPNTKTDMYSLGVIMLELLTGKSPSEPTNGMDLPQWVASVVAEEYTNDVYDLELMRDATTGDELLNTLKLALHCCDPTPTARPDAQPVLEQLEQIRPLAAASASDDHESFKSIEQ
ncbi:hypothetical protein ACHQM5_025334 [Ranunculus cassubicifolius]